MARMNWTKTAVEQRDRRAKSDERFVRDPEQPTPKCVRFFCKRCGGPAFCKSAQYSEILSGKRQKLCYGCAKNSTIPKRKYPCLSCGTVYLLDSRGVKAYKAAGKVCKKCKAVDAAKQHNASIVVRAPHSNNVTRNEAAESPLPTVQCSV